MLKANTVEFVPPLPATKQRAIKRLGSGLLNKVVLCFNTVFWNKHITWIGQAAQTEQDFFWQVTTHLLLHIKRDSGSVNTLARCQLFVAA